MPQILAFTLSPLISHGSFVSITPLKTQHSSLIRAKPAERCFPAPDPGRDRPSWRLRILATGGDDDVFINCRVCGSDVVFERARVRGAAAGGSVSVRCPECGTRFRAPAEDFVRVTADGRIVSAELDPPVGAGAGDGGGRPEVRVWVGGLAPRVDDARLRQVFQQFGEVRSVRVVCDRVTGRSRGFAFVGMGSLRDAIAAIDLVQGERSLGTRVRAKLAENA